MTRGTIFWILMLLWLVFSLWFGWNRGQVNYIFVGGSLLQFILFTLLGWNVFGPAIKG